MRLPPCGSATDVNNQVLQTHLIYGSSNNSNPRGLASSRALNFAQGPTIQRPIIERLTVSPYDLHFQDSVGLFGAENCFVRVDMDLQDYIGDVCYEEPFWECAHVSEAGAATPYYDDAIIDNDADLVTVNSYEPARFNKQIQLATNTGLVHVALINNKTGNRYVDDWLDVRLYTADRQEHPSNDLLVPLRGFFYIGFHARNTRELAYNVTLRVGDVVSRTQLSNSQREWLPASQRGNLSLANASY